MKKSFLIIALSIFGMTTTLPAVSGGSIAYAQKKDKDDKKSPTPPPVIRDKGKQEKPKEPPRKDKKPD